MPSRSLQAARTLAALTALAGLALAASPARAAHAQPLNERTPNMEGAWVPESHDLLFSFAHRFEIAGEDERVDDLFGDGKVVNYPSFALAYGIAPRSALGVRYSSNSLIAGRVNEWQPYAKFVPVRAFGKRVEVSLLGAWNAANESVDGEAAVETAAGPLRLIGAVRGFSSPLDREEDEAEWAVAAGASVALNEHLSLSADYANMLSEADAQVGWSAGLAARIPYTPHTLAFYATNVTSSTLEGVSVGLDDAVFWGFEFTVPLSGHRWGRIFDPGKPAGPAGGSAAQPDGAAPALPASVSGAVSPARVLDVDIRELKFDAAEIVVAPGTTVRWTNRDPLAHTATAVDGTWDSGLIEPGEAFERTFDAAGRHEYLCTPHPFMKGVVVVREAE